MTQQQLKNDTEQRGVTCVNEIKVLLNSTLERKVNKMPSDASCPQRRGRVDVHLYGHVLKVLLESLNLALFWLCQLFICCWL